MEFLPAYQFYTQLSTDKYCYKELLKFSKQYITGTLPTITQIYGDGTLLLHLLSLLVNHEFTICRTLTLKPRHYKYDYVIVDCAINALQVKEIKNLKTKFIFMGDADYTLPLEVHLLEVNNKHNTHFNFDLFDEYIRADYVKLILK